MESGSYTPYSCQRCGRSIKWGEHIFVFDCRIDRIIHGYCRDCWRFYQDLMCGGDDKS